MNSNEITFVYFISDNLAETIFIKNNLKSNLQHIVIVTLDNYQPKYIKSYKHIQIKEYSLEGIKSISSQIETEWFMLMKPEEALLYQIKINKPEPGIYGVIVEQCLDKNISNNLIYGEIKLFHKYSDNISVEFLNILVSNSAHLFPEIEKLKMHSYIEAFKSGDKSLKIIMYLIEKRLINIGPQELFDNYYDPSSNDVSMLAMLRHISRIYIIKKDLDKAKDILLKALLNFPDSPCINSLLSEVYFMQKDYKQAKGFILNCISMYKNNSFYKYLPFNVAIIGYAAYYFLGEIHSQNGEYLNAKSAYEDSIDINPKFSPSINAHKRVTELIEQNSNYINELDFACQGCGNCCRDFKHVNITHHDVAKIIKNRPDIDINEYISFYYDERIKLYQFSLKKKSDSRDCIFLDNSLCTINSFKPIGCKTWPFILRKNDNVTWSDNNRVFIKNKCSFKSIKGANNKEQLINELNTYAQYETEMVSVIKEWKDKINNSEGKITQEFIDYLVNTTNV